MGAGSTPSTPSSTPALYYLDHHRKAGFDLNQRARSRPTAISRYFAFTIGMSYAVSDIEPASTTIRRKALPHALMSYLFGTMLIAVAINLVTNLG